jgi:hypothetical protein
MGLHQLQSELDWCQEELGWQRLEGRDIGLGLGGVIVIAE